ncbi:MAG: GDP-mannose 4,6-dehydratase, partial [Burkholderiaceae bacterium]|nr:GDP-mannose 4,6-dehydratase [Burkholderiaceae bacterium]
MRLPSTDDASAEIEPAFTRWQRADSRSVAVSYHGQAPKAYPAPQWPTPVVGLDFNAHTTPLSRGNMKIVVTGGAGFIGSNFLNLLVPRHPEHMFINVDELTYAANLKNLAPIEKAPNYAFRRVDIAKFDQVMALFEEESPDLVVHFAAESHVDRSISAPRTFIRANVEGTGNLLEACRAHWKPGQGLFHHVSTDEVYGSLGETGFFTEDTRYDPSSPYSASKAASDHLVRAYVRTFGLAA